MCDHVHWHCVRRYFERIYTTKHQHFFIHNFKIIIKKKVHSNFCVVVSFVVIQMCAKPFWRCLYSRYFIVCVLNAQLRRCRRYISCIDTLLNGWWQNAPYSQLGTYAEQTMQRDDLIVNYKSFACPPISCGWMNGTHKTYGQTIFFEWVLRIERWRMRD